MKFKELESSLFTDLRSNLIKEKGSDEQIEFLNASQESVTFCAWIRNKLDGKIVGARDIDLYPEKLSENEFKNTTQVVEENAFSNWKDLTPRMTCRSSFWGAVTFNHIEQGVIKSSYLAAPNNSRISGITRIKKALESESIKEKDDVVRTILRRFSGLPEARGVFRTITVNCVFGRAWWREYMIADIIALTQTKGNRDEISRTLRQSQEFWEKLMNLLSANSAVFGDGKIRAAFIWALSKHLDDKSHKKLFSSTETIDTCMNKLGVYSATQEFGVFSTEELCDLIENQIIGPIVGSPTAAGDGR